MDIFPQLCFISLLVNTVYSASPRVDPLVLIEQGLVRGLKSTDGDYSAFLGIPYAKVDLKNPFGASVPHPGFEEEIFNAYNGNIRCPQVPQQNIDLKNTESSDETLECLTLNIYVPEEASTQNPLPVFVWIHGGGFQGNSAGNDGVPYLVKQGVIVAMINYRLGPYGFLCLDSPLVPGNQGLKDQYEALLWVRKNIAAFGGNPYNVTIGGLSAGGSSVIYHLYSDKEKIFDKVIAHSGVAEVVGLFVERDPEAAVKLANHLGLNTSNTDEALEFLSETSHDLVIGAYVELGLSLMPCKENSYSGVENYVESNPYSFSNERKVRNTPILIGNTDKEMSISDATNELNINVIEERMKTSFNLNEEELLEITETVKHFYIGDETQAGNIMSNLEDFASDFVFNHPIQRTITKLVTENASPIYEYLFTYTGDSELSGAAHWSDQKYLFDTENDFNVNDTLISDRMTSMWANFIKFGNPTPQTTDVVPIIWEPITKNTRPYLVIDTDIRMENRVFKERMAFWDLFYSIYGKYSYLARDCSI